MSAAHAHFAARVGAIKTVFSRASAIWHRRCRRRCGRHRCDLLKPGILSVQIVTLRPACPMPASISRNVHLATTALVSVMTKSAKNADSLSTWRPTSSQKPKRRVEMRRAKFASLVAYRCLCCRAFRAANEIYPNYEHRRSRYKFC